MPDGIPKASAQPCYNKMSRHRACAARERCYSESCGVSCGISYCENRVCSLGGDKGCADDLRVSHSSACDSICKLLSVKGEDQLTRLCDANLEAYLIGADLCKIKARIIQSSDIRVKDRSVLREAYVCARGNRCGIVGRHNRIKICE